MNPGPGFCEILAFFTNLVGHPCQNAVGYAVLDSIDQTTADAVSNALAEAYKNQLSSSGRFNGVRIIVGNDGPPGEFNSVAGAGAGVVSGDFEQAQVMGLIHKSTAFAGRKFRGRMYIPDMSDSQVGDTGIPNSTALGKLNAIASAWFTLSGVVTTLGAPQILHADGVTAPTEIVSMDAEGKIATQRRRYPR